MSLREVKQVSWGSYLVKGCLVTELDKESESRDFGVIITWEGLLLRRLLRTGTTSA